VAEVVAPLLARRAARARIAFVRAIEVASFVRRAGDHERVTVRCGEPRACVGGARTTCLEKSGLLVLGDRRRRRLDDGERDARLRRRRRWMRRARAREKKEETAEIRLHARWYVADPANLPSLDDSRTCAAATMAARTSDRVALTNISSS